DGSRPVSCTNDQYRLPCHSFTARRSVCWPGLPKPRTAMTSYQCDLLPGVEIMIRAPRPKWRLKLRVPNPRPVVWESSGKVVWESSGSRLGDGVRLFCTVPRRPAAVSRRLGVLAFTAGATSAQGRWQRSTAAKDEVRTTRLTAGSPLHLDRPCSLCHID